MKNLTNVINLIKDYTQDFIVVDNYGKEKTTFEIASETIYEIISMKKFVIDEYESLMLCKTKTNLELVKMPFDKMYVDLNLRIYDIEIIGLIIQKIKPMHHFKNIEDIFISGYFINTKTNWHGVFECSIMCDEIVGLNFNNPRELITNANVDNEKQIKLAKKNYEFQRLIEKNMKYFTVNLLKFITEPDVEIMEVNYKPEINEKRIKRGQIPITNINYIRINGILKKYINCFKEIPIRTLQNSVWVRGHWRTFRATRYKNMKNKKIWILPFIRGSGKLIDNIYHVRKEYLDKGKGESNG